MCEKCRKNSQMIKKPKGSIRVKAKPKVPNIKHKKEKLK